MSKAQIANQKNQMGKITGKRLLMLFLIIILAAASIYASAEPGTVVTEGGRLNMRKSPEDKAKIVTKIKNGKTVEVLGHEGNGQFSRSNYSRTD